MNEKGMDTKIYKVLSYFPFLWAIGLLSPYHNDSDVRFHINQGIILTIFTVVEAIVSELIIRLVILNIFNEETITFGTKTKIYTTTPLGTGIVIGIRLLVGSIYIFYLVKGFINAFRGEEKQLPYIGDIAIIK